MKGSESMRLETGFVDFDPVRLAPTDSGPLDGLRFAVKDVIDVAGTVTGNGHPEWRRTHGPATAHADCVARLLAAGATLVGKTHTDELTYSLAGQNVHYGTPPNPAVPDGIPGGSSSGSASVVAAGLVDFAIGTDTGGSVRVPASYCGIYGLRPSHGAVDNRGVSELARSFDTVGWFARDPRLLRAVGEVLLPPRPALPLRRIRLLSEGLAAAGPALARAARERIGAGGLGLTVDEELSVGPLEAFFQAFRPLQAYEAWAYFGPWIRAHRPTFGPGVRERFAAAAQVSDEEAAAARHNCQRLREQVRALLSDDTVLCMPTTPSAAPRLGVTDAEVEDVRFRTLCMTAVAGVAGLPQVSVPLLRDERGPVGLSLIGPAGSDLQLLALAERLAASA